ncbi:glycosyltransferase [Desulfovibrio fairfieldensis]|uniref:glycosyltransferase n=1 Tax=Desulfovibrio fairfieldensis TaxID=44742 RepID=UPI0009FAB4E0|nr:glycosyltransferase [Desulfovibrio fairfieldensis]
MPAPIAIFAFNRPDLLQQTIAALMANPLSEKSNVTIFCDGPRDEAEALLTGQVRSIAKSVKGFATLDVVTRDENLGGFRAIPDGMRQMFNLYDSLIVLEDDILLSPFALEYFNNALNKYEDKRSVFTISAWSPSANFIRAPRDYPFEVCFFPNFGGWGWAIWKDRFDLIDWSFPEKEDIENYPVLLNNMACIQPNLVKLMLHQKHKINWDVCVDFYRFKNGLLSLFPLKSLAVNIGLFSGQHPVNSIPQYMDIQLTSDHAPDLIDYVFCDPRLMRKFLLAFSGDRSFAFFSRMINWCKCIFSQKFI